MSHVEEREGGERRDREEGERWERRGDEEKRHEEVNSYKCILGMCDNF